MGSHPKATSTGIPMWTARESPSTMLVSVPTPSSATTGAGAQGIIPVCGGAKNRRQHSGVIAAPM